jgi:hypothetical protein
MLIDAKEIFLIRSSENGNPVAMSELYSIYGNDASDEKFGKAALLYQKTLMEYPPNEAMKILYRDKGIEKLTKHELEMKYFKSMRLVAVYMSDCKLFDKCTIWAKKGLELFENFIENFSPEYKEEIKKNNKYYHELLGYFEKYKQYFDQHYYDTINHGKKVTFAWEEKYFSEPVLTNDNIKN